MMIQTEQQYQTLVERIEELLQNPKNIENQHAKGHIELNVLSDLVANYEEQNFPVKQPLLADVMKLRMAELGLNQKGLSELLGVSTSRVSEYLTGKSEPTLQVARKISQQLDIEPAIVLGV
jgi:HTH-type transcriptional regulator/antitoxin HigA